MTLCLPCILLLDSVFNVWPRGVQRHSSVAQIQRLTKARKPALQTTLFVFMGFSPRPDCCQMLCCSSWSRLRNKNHTSSLISAAVTLNANESTRGTDQRRLWCLTAVVLQVLTLVYTAKLPKTCQASFFLQPVKAAQRLYPVETLNTTPGVETIRDSLMITKAKYLVFKC